MLTAFLTSAAIVTLAEIGDKTMLLAIVLAARLRRPWAIVAGIFGATVLNHGLSAVESACAEALEAGIASGDVILTVLARRRQPEMPPSITTPDALRLKIEPAADCGRYDSIRKVA